MIVGTHGRSVYVANVKHLQMLSEKILSKNIHVFELEKIKFSPRWGSKGWGSNFYTPEIQIVYYSASSLPTKINVIHENKILKTLDFDATSGLNFISYDLSIDKKEQSSNDNGLHYLTKGKYTVEVIQNDNVSNVKLIID